VEATLICRRHEIMSYWQGCGLHWIARQSASGFCIQHPAFDKPILQRVADAL